jgi:hypothetical protein
VRLPQRPAVIKVIVVLLAGILPALALGGAAHAASRQALFSCGTDGTEDRGFLELGGIPEDSGNWVDLRFDRRADGDGHLVYSFPRGGVDSRTAFLFSHSDGPEGYLVSVRWRDEGYDYVIYSLAIRPDPSDENDMGGGDAGLVISSHGRLIDRVPCSERPSMLIASMRGTMACDDASLYGEEACAADPVQRTEPLDLEAIGIVD